MLYKVITIKYDFLPVATSETQRIQCSLLRTLVPVLFNHSFIHPSIHSIPFIHSSFNSELSTQKMGNFWHYPNLGHYICNFGFIAMRTFSLLFRSVPFHSIVSVGANLDFANENFYSIRQVFFGLLLNGHTFPSFNEVLAYSRSSKRITKDTHEWRLSNLPLVCSVCTSSNPQQIKSRTNKFIKSENLVKKCWTEYFSVHLLLVFRHFCMKIYYLKKMPKIIYRSINIRFVGHLWFRLGFISI